MIFSLYGHRSDAKATRPTLNFSNLHKTCNIGLPSLFKAGIDALKVTFKIINITVVSAKNKY